MIEAFLAMIKDILAMPGIALIVPSLLVGLFVGVAIGIKLGKRK